jgi:hypothetical protein
VATLLATDATTAIAIAAGAIAVGALALIIWAPWRTVRDEPPLSPEVEARLLLGEDPAQIAADEDATPRPPDAGASGREPGFPASSERPEQTGSTADGGG